MKARTRGYKTLLMLNSAEHKILTSQKTKKVLKNKKFLDLSLSDLVFVMLINVKMPTIFNILTFMEVWKFINKQ